MRLNEWNKSTYSGASPNCVETCLRAPVRPVVGLRDTQNRTQGQLDFDQEEWIATLAATKG